jgi:multidrug efflux pump subunit AcrA (membrane-fusion protein)
MLALAVMLAATAAPAATRKVVLTGQVRAPDAEGIYAPMADSSPVVLRFLAPEGSEVKPGDPLVRIDPGSSLASQEMLQSQISQTRARVAKELAELAVKEVDAELAFVDAQAALAKAKVDAAIPADYIARIDADRYQGEFERAQRELVLKQGELDAARAATRRRRDDAALEIAKLDTDLRFAAANIAAAEQRAQGRGVVVYSFNPWTGQRYEEGASVNSGSLIGEVIQEGSLSVRVHALEPDRRGLALGQALELQFDAIPGRPVPGRISAISGAPQAKAEWGAGRYFLVDVDLPANHGLPLRPGMSARVLASLEAPTNSPAAATKTGATP